MTFPAALAGASQRVHARLDAALADLPDSRVRAAMAHALKGGKGLRGFLVLESCALHDQPDPAALSAAAAIEAMHSYSLVHDDLPAMDDDDLRRGQPTVHVAFDEATAILAGDALQSLAFDLLADPAMPNPAALVRGLARAAGAGGMVLGQALDIQAETATSPLTLDQIADLQAGKTGALFRWSCTAGPVMAGADPAPLATYADALGLAFQIADDLLDAEGDAAAAGKRVGKDAGAGKATFVSHLGLDGARRRAAALVEQACDALSPHGPRADLLRAAARFVIARDR
jgi:farnesyl diphosphate synthase